jgi:hypothetical protein
VWRTKGAHLILPVSWKFHHRHRCARGRPPVADHEQQKQEENVVVADEEEEDVGRAQNERKGHISAVQKKKGLCLLSLSFFIRSQHSHKKTINRPFRLIFCLPSFLLKPTNNIHHHHLLLHDIKQPTDLLVFQEASIPNDNIEEKQTNPKSQRKEVSVTMKNVLFSTSVTRAAAVILAMTLLSSTTTTTVVNAQQQVCNICLSGSAITNPFAVFIFGQPVTCGEAQLAGQAGLLTPEECLQAQFFASAFGNPCGCDLLPATPAPTSNPAPASFPTNAPVLPTNAPTPAPVRQPFCNICQLSGGGRAQCNGILGAGQCIDVRNWRNAVWCNETWNFEPAMCCCAVMMFVTYLLVDDDDCFNVF